MSSIKKLTLMEKGLLVAVAVCFLLLLVLNWRTRAVAAEAASLQQQVEQTQQRLRAIPLEDLPALRKRIEELQAHPLAFPKKVDAEAAMVNLWDWAEKKGVRLLRTNYSSSAASLGDWQFPQHTFNMEGLGDREDIIAFLQVLEGSPFRAVRLDDWSLTPGAGGRWRFVVTLNIWSEGQKRAVPQTPGGR